MTRFNLSGINWPEWIADRWLGTGGTARSNTEPAVSQLLYALAIARRPRVIVETGLLRAAGTTPWLAWAAQEVGALHIAIDNDPKACAHAREMLEERDWLVVKNTNVGSMVVCEDALVAATRFADGAIDFLFIDDNHETDHVEREIDTFLPKMAPGSAMFFHDVIGSGDDFQIWDLIHRHGGIRLANRTYNYPENLPFGGLGMISVNDHDRDGLYGVPPRPLAWQG